MSANDGGTAFPAQEILGLYGNREQDASPGMSLRDYFAGQALAGNVFTWFHSSLDYEFDAGQMAKMVYEIADAMLAERNN